jgi:hypothetical protein
VPHGELYVKVVAVRSSPPKFRPLMVTDPPPLRTAFSRTPLATGASKDTTPIAVPSADPDLSTSSMLVADGIMTAYDTGVHLTAVVVVQEVVRQSLVASATDAVNAIWPKFRPEIVTEDPPVNGVLG